MKVFGPIIMLRFSVSPHVDGRRRNTGTELFPAALDASWWQVRGEREELTTERWVEKAPNIWLAMSRKR